MKNTTFVVVVRRVTTDAVKVVVEAPSYQEAEARARTKAEKPTTSWNEIGERYEVDSIRVSR